MRCTPTPSAKGVLVKHFRTNIGSTILRGRGTMMLARLAHVGPTSAQSSRRHQSLAERSFLGSLHIDQLAAYYNGGARSCRGG